MITKPSYRPTDKQRMLVAVLAGCGVPQQVICNRPEIKCTLKTLRKYYRKELTQGKEEANAQVMISAFNQAIRPNGGAMTMFWLKCQARWKEVRELEVKNTTDKPVKEMTDSELQKIVKDDPEK